MEKNIRFSYTTSSKNFSKKFSSILKEHFEDTELMKHVHELCDYLEKEQLDMFLASVKSFKDKIELTQLIIADAEQNISAFNSLSEVQTLPQEVENVQATQTSVENASNAVMPPSPPLKSTEDAFEQLKRLESILSVVKEMKPKE